jgi:NADH:ubiquinone oxidoreductase subunit C
MPAHPPAEILAIAGVPCEASHEWLGQVLRVDAQRVDDALAALQTIGYDFLVDLFGTDTGEQIELTYHLRAFATLEDLYLKALVDYDGEAPSVWRIFPAALYAEREAAELLGMSFPGHPNPKRLLTAEGLPPMLRKSELIREAGEVQLPYE